MLSEDPGRILCVLKRNTPMRTKILGAIIFSAVSVMALPVVAQQSQSSSIIQNAGEQERINFSGKLRMLSQRIPSAACHLAEGVDNAGATQLLKSASDEFEKILTALEFGDESLNIIGQEERRKTLARIHDLRAQWEPMKVAAAQMAAGDTSDEVLSVVLEQNMPVLNSAKLLVSEMVAQYSNPATMVQANSLLIDIAGRQRMLTQKMAKESCILASDLADNETKANLEATMQMFEVSLFALMNGMQEAGIKAPPSFQISEGLRHVSLEYAQAKPTLDSLLSGQKVSLDAEATKFKTLNTTMGKMNEVVQMYTSTMKVGL